MRADVLRILSMGLILLAAQFSWGDPPHQSPPALSKAVRAGGDKGVEILARAASRHAILVGVNDYEECSDLAYCKADVMALAERLVATGFDRRDIVVLTDGAKILPYRRNIDEQLSSALAVADAGDLVLVALSGHGARIGGRSYFCPRDARPDDPEGSMIAIDDLYQKFEKCPARLKIFLIDACRNNFLPVEARPLAEQGKSIDAFARSLSDGRLPRGMALLASCTSGERSWEDKALGHGVFMHYILEGLAGSADRAAASGDQDGWVSLFELCDYVRMETKTHVRRTRRKTQRPHYHTSLDLPDFRLTKTSPRQIPCFTEWPFDAAEAQRRQKLTAGAVGRPVDFVNSIGMTFRLIPAGRFVMGSQESEGFPNEHPAHEVTLRNGFYLGATEVTQSQYEAVMGARPAYFGPSGAGREKIAPADWRTLPVERVSYEEALAFCGRLAEQEGRRPGAYRLPTEAEWEYAARAGQSSSAGPSELPRAAWYGKTAGGSPHPVGGLTANAFGLRDTLGNVAEWCSDWYVDDFYARSPAVDPSGPAEADRFVKRVVRGGSWNDSENYCRAADRQFASPTARENCFGFRLVLVLP